MSWGVKARQGNAEALNKLISANLRFVVTVAKKYQRMGLSLEDLINEGNLGLIKAAQKFDPGKGCKFITYAVFWIRQSILFAIENHSRTIRISNYMAGIMRKVEKTVSTYQQSFQRAPSLEEVAELTGISESDLRQVSICKSQICSIDDSVFGNSTCLCDHLEDISSVNPESEVEKILNKAEIEKVLNGLNERERLVVNRLFGFDGVDPVNIQVIADDLHLTHERVRQIKNKVLCKLKRLLLKLQ